MTERRHDLGWLGVFTGMTGLILLVLLILIALGERVAGEAGRTAQGETQIEVAGAPGQSAAQPEVSAETAVQTPDLAALLQDGETMQVRFAGDLSVAGQVQIANGVLAILNPLGEAIDLGEVEILVKANGQTLVPAEFGIQPAQPAAPVGLEVELPAETEATGAAPAIAVEPVAVEVVAVEVVAVEAVTGASGVAQVEANGPGDLPVSAILDQYPKGTLFTVTLQNGEQVVAMKENRLKLVRVDATGTPSKSLVPPWMIESLAPVS